MTRDHMLGFPPVLDAIDPKPTRAMREGTRAHEPRRVADVLDKMQYRDFVRLKPGEAEQVGRLSSSDPLLGRSIELTETPLPLRQHEVARGRVGVDGRPYFFLDSKLDEPVKGSFTINGTLAGVDAYAQAAGSFLNGQNKFTKLRPNRYTARLDEVAGQASVGGVRMLREQANRMLDAVYDSLRTYGAPERAQREIITRMQDLAECAARSPKHPAYY